MVPVRVLSSSRPVLSRRARGDRAARDSGRFLSGLLFLCAATIGTDTDDPKQMLCDFESMFRSHCVLDRFEFGRKEFDDLSAFGADHVIVVLVFVVVFVVRAAVAKTNLARQAGIRQQLQCAIDGCVANGGIFLLHESIEIFAGEVLFLSQKDLKDQIALGGALQSLFLNVLKKNFLLFSHDG
jgi:hypothetical protein